MTGKRITNDHSFDCEVLANNTVEYFSAFYTDQSRSDVLMLVLKLKEIALYQRFFLDAALGFWEEWDEEDNFYDLEDLEHVDLANELNLLGKKVLSIACKGSFEEFSSIEFVFEGVNLLLKFSDHNDIESDIVLERL
ncbi:hypothetical protein [Thiomicrorhabdus xiamenensis]|uniref:Uncharacterized protein n=1 Tax=Thiomicrorhabdus xiamenensis TaxID=2739063 RepID=A0A7D4NQC2_9GAMM|nr:hypothetical protein [Thiomicrorhabdus xiamenensis]QKI89051.1 hypothetical protein HQN79_05430 [Thiomicrorhabdus xiamenensis]